MPRGRTVNKNVYLHLSQSFQYNDCQLNQYYAERVKEKSSTITVSTMHTLSLLMDETFTGLIDIEKAFDSVQ